MNDSACAQCRYFVPIDDEGGECRRFPPTLQTDDEGTISTFPGTSASWFCGEFVRLVN